MNIELLFGVQVNRSWYAYLATSSTYRARNPDYCYLRKVSSDQVTGSGGVVGAIDVVGYRGDGEEGFGTNGVFA